MVQRHEHNIEALHELGTAEVRDREENLAHFDGPVEPKRKKIKYRCQNTPFTHRWVKWVYRCIKQRYCKEYSELTQYRLSLTYWCGQVNNTRVWPKFDVDDLF